MSNLYSSKFNNPYGRTYRKPQKFKTEIKHIIQDMRDVARYNAELERAEREKLRLIALEKSEKQAKKDAEDYVIFAKKIEIPEITRYQDITMDLHEKNYDFNYIYSEWSKIIKNKLNVSDDILLLNEVLQNMNVSGVAGQEMGGKHAGCLFFLLILVLLIIELTVIKDNFYLFLGVFLATLIAVISIFRIINQKILNKFLIKKEEKTKEVNEYLEKLYAPEIKFNFLLNERLANLYADLITSFKDLSSSEKIWDMLKSTRFLANIDRKEVKVVTEYPNSLSSNLPTFNLQNDDGADFYFFPLFVIFFDTDSMIFIDYKDFEIKFSILRFTEYDGVYPSDSKVIDYAWEKMTKNGLPDARYVNNKQVPIVEYALIEIGLPNNQTEKYIISNVKNAKTVVEKLLKIKEYFILSNN